MRSSPREPDARLFWETCAEAVRTGYPLPPKSEFFSSDSTNMVTWLSPVDRFSAAILSLQVRLSWARFLPIDRRSFPSAVGIGIPFEGGALRSTGPVDCVSGTSYEHDGRPSLCPEDAIRRCLIRAGSFWSDGMALSRTPVPRFEGSLDSPRRSFTPQPSWLVRHWPQVV